MLKHMEVPEDNRLSKLVLNILTWGRRERGSLRKVKSTGIPGKLHDDFQNSELNLSNHRIYRQDKGFETSHRRRGGRVLITVHKMFSSVVIDILNTRAE
ncbi:Protein of unknown function [Gryllus bimaculatus]|nr:Protein of unknown function [Gryllus bimaculatus]